MTPRSHADRIAQMEVAARTWREADVALRQALAEQRPVDEIRHYRLAVERASREYMTLSRTMPITSRPAPAPARPFGNARPSESPAYRNAQDRYEAAMRERSLALKAFEAAEAIDDSDEEREAGARVIAADEVLTAAAGEMLRLAAMGPASVKADHSLVGCFGWTVIGFVCGGTLALAFWFLTGTGIVTMQVVEWWGWIPLVLGVLIGTATGLIRMVNPNQTPLIDPSSKARAGCFNIGGVGLLLGLIAGFFIGSAMGSFKVGATILLACTVGGMLIGIIRGSLRAGTTP